MKQFRIIVTVLFLGLTLFVEAQETFLQLANKQFDNQEYAKSVISYQQVIDENTLSESQLRQVKANIGYAYFQLGDNLKAEKAYRDFFDGGEVTSGPLAVHNLHYAQVLAKNGKFKESEDVLSKYEASKNDGIKSSKNNSNFNKSKSNYKLEYLSLNSNESEFSPVFYKSGLVYVSGKMAAISSESLRQGNMDLIFASNRNALQASTSTNAEGVESKFEKAKRGSSVGYFEPRLGRDTYTRSTSNDSKSVGRYETYGSDYQGGGGSSGASYSSRSEKPSSFSKSLNTKYHEGPATFSADGSEIIFTRNNFNEGRKGESEGNDVKLKLYSATLGVSDWENVAELPFNSDEYSTAHPALSKDGSRLYFVSDMPGGVGGKDLYVTFREGNGWSKPKNLGKEINGRSDELFPFVDENGNLYFSTAGRKGGLGGMDIYYAILSRDGLKVIDIVPLEAPINSSGDDFGIVTNSDRSVGFFSSDRRAGDDDIYRFVKENSISDCRELTLRVFDSETQLPIDSAVIIAKSRSNGETKELITDESGRAHLCLSSNNDFMFTAQKTGFLNNTIGFSTKGLTDDRPTRLEMSLNKPTMLMDTLENDPLPVVASKPQIQTKAEPENKTKGIAEKQTKQPKPKPEKTKTENIAENDGWGEEPATSKLTKSLMEIEGQILDENNGLPIEGAVVKLISNCTGKSVQTVSTSKDGRYKFSFKDFSCTYTAVMTKKSYTTFVKKINTLPKKNQKVVPEVVTLLKVGELIRVNNINFENGKADILPDAARELNKIAVTMKKYATTNFEVISHTDSRGEAEVNKNISRRRAQKIVDYLVSKGVGKNQVKAFGMGESQPLNGCVDGVICTEGEYQRNRRTEFKVVGSK